MRVLPPPEPSPLTAFFCAPLVTPVLAVPLAAFLPNLYSNEFDLLVVGPFVAIFSLIYGYLGMIFVCLPVILVLRYLRKLNSVTLYVLTTAIGATVFALLFHDLSGPEPNGFWAVFAVGAGCSFGVTTFFCLLSGITIRSSRTRPASRAGSA